MKTRLLLFAMAFLGYCTVIQAQPPFSYTYQTGIAQNHSGFIMEKSLTAAGGYIIVSTMYVNPNPFSPTNGIRITSVDAAGSVQWDRKYTNFPDIHAMDICQDPSSGTYLITGYVLQGAFNRLFIARITQAGVVTGFMYLAVGPFNNYHHHGMSITTYAGGRVAVAGVATRLLPTAANVPGQSNQLFVTVLTPALVHVNTSYTAHQSAGPNNYHEVPLHIMDVPTAGTAGFLHVTGAVESNMPGTQEATMNMFFDYNAQYQWEQCIMDPAEFGEIGQFAYYDNVYNLIYILSYAVSSRMVTVYAVNPAPGGGVIVASRFSDPSFNIYTMYGLTLTKDNVNSPDELFISGYIPDNAIYNPNTMPTFTVSLYIPDLLSGTTGFPALFAYPDPDNSGYRFFDFSNNMFANSNPVLNMPTNLGYTSDMTVLDNNMNIVMATPRFSQMFGGYHPTINQNAFYYWHQCTSDIYSVQYDRWPFAIVPRISNLVPQATQSRITTPGATPLNWTTYDCSMTFFAPNSQNDENGENTLDNEEQIMTVYKVYPTVVNEASADLTLELTDVADHNLTISIYDAAGRKIFQQNANSVAGNNRIIIKAENLAKGLNILHVTGLEKPLVTKLLRN